MDSKQWRRVKDLFTATLNLPPGERGALLNNEDEIIRVEVEKLLSNYTEAEDFIGAPAVVELGINGADESLNGKKIDDYLIVKQIGAGGMGAVYLAEQQSENLSHRVALKLIKRGMDTNSVLKRFVMERQILANLEHPNIGRFLDGGSTADGLPYFVMEYVEGLPVTKYCEAHDLSIEARLELFRQICAAVSFAHRNLIVHRDLKPSNILVGEDGTPKLLDFGIAKLLNPDWSLDTAEATATAFRVMTPEYASPEQLRGENVTTASDVYSLGVVLYELLTGERPHKIESRSPEEAARIVLTEEPLRPSSVASRPSNNSTAKTKQRTTDNGQRTKSLKGDLDNIILKALRKEPERRYQSVQEFSEDIRRHLEGLPVTATADTAFYRAAKFVKRHKAGVFATVLIALTLVSATVVTAWQARRANRERAKAEQRFNDVRKLSNSFLFEFHGAIEELPGSTAARALVVKKALEYLDILAAENSDDISLRYELAVAYAKVADIQGKDSATNLGETQNALANYGKAAAILEGLVAADENNSSYLNLLAAVNLEMSLIQNQRGEKENFLKSNQRSVELFEKITTVEPANAEAKLQLSSAYKGLGDVIASEGDLEAAIKQYRKGSQMAQAVLDSQPDNEKAVWSLLVSDEAIAATLGNPNFTNLGDKKGALELYKKMLGMTAEMLKKNPTHARYLGNYAYFLQNTGLLAAANDDWQTALTHLREAVAVQQKIMRADAENSVAQWRFANILTDLADAVSQTGKIEEALEYHRQAIEILEKANAKDRENVELAAFLARAYRKKGDSLVKAKNIDSALDFYLKSLKINEAAASEDATNMDVRWALAQDYEKIGKANFLLAENSAASSPKRNEFFREARSRYNQSLSVYTEMQTNNLKVSPIKNAAENLLSEIARCDNYLK